MPVIAPPGGAVDWPADEGTLGVVGVAPWATLDFLRAFYALVPASKDWHFPRVIADVNTKLPSRGRHLELGETDPSPAIAQTIRELHAQGATVVVVPCNTAHVLHERWAAGSPVPLPHIVRETARALAAAGAGRVAALTSRSLRQHGLYDRCLADEGLSVQPLDEAEAGTVAEAIEAIKRSGALDERLRTRIGQLLDTLRGRDVQGVALGCTELASLQPLCAARGLVSAESNEALARAALVALAPHRFA